MAQEHLGQRLDDLNFERANDLERAEIEAHLAACEACARRRAAIEAAYAELALSLPRAAPRERLRARVLASVAHLERFTSLAPRLAGLIDIPVHDARRALHVFARPDEMPPTALPGMRAWPLSPGPRRSTARAILACVEPGAAIPRHTHPGDEHILVFQGAFVADDGRVIRGGQELHSGAGSAHAVERVLGDEPCLCAIVNDAAIEMW
jgi:putative transcriptional regulator